MFVIAKSVPHSPFVAGAAIAVRRSNNPNRRSRSLVFPMTGRTWGKKQCYGILYSNSTMRIPAGHHVVIAYRRSAEFGVLEQGFYR
jgi:hypothetical protein